MFRLSLLFLVVAIVAGVFGFTGIAASVSYMARIIFGIALILFLVALISGRIRYNRP